MFYITKFLEWRAKNVGFQSKNAGEIKRSGVLG